ncbi:mediator complex protein-domain-containing protein [Phyllosticta citribraziliensis]|uniref:Mediator of RNA polymerase II transcription subunit 11 n=1 Tax=Phyllosticta citribraziliensis TaxID=989973 RepID=A0ABR1M7C4_9PEZI
MANAEEARGARDHVNLAVEHIQELSKIKEDIPRLLTAAGSAVSALTNREIPPPPSSSSADPSSISDSPLEARKAAFSAHTKQYFSLVRTIQDNLMRQIGALEDAGVIPAKAEKVEGGSGAGGEVKNGGLGELDVGWLNARTRDVGVVKGAELVAEARKRLEARLGDGEGQDGEDTHMG